MSRIVEGSSGGGVCRIKSALEACHPQLSVIDKGTATGAVPWAASPRAVSVPL